MQTIIKPSVAGVLALALGIELAHEANLPSHTEARQYEEPSKLTVSANHTATVNVTAIVSSFGWSDSLMPDCF